jgi:GTPase
MIDTVRLNIKAGSGGSGCVSFLREKYRPKGGPNGGDGGVGGSAYIVGDPSLNTLLHLKYNSTIYAARGGHGKGKNQRGANGEDSFIRVPIGTVVWRMQPQGKGPFGTVQDSPREFVADIIDDTPRLVARGGRGGWGNAHYVSPTNQEPVLSQKGEDSESVVLFLELKLLADVGLLAKPNAGKSTLISRCSAAKPRIADYPFTTVEPVLGVVTSRGKDFVMMEVPGLIEGAHEGVGLGHQFLRHAERARLYIHLIDGLSEDPIGDFHMINEELRQFNPALAEKPQILAVGKADVTEVRERRKALEMALREALREYPHPTPPIPPFPRGGMGETPSPRRSDHIRPFTRGQPEEPPLTKGGPGGVNGIEPPIFFISSVTGEGIQPMVDYVMELLDVLPKEIDLIPPEVDQAQTAGQRQQRERKPMGFHKENGVYVIESEQLERLSVLADLRDYRVLLQLWREMTRLGIARQLEEAGIEPGDTIRIGRAEMEWF